MPAPKHDPNAPDQICCGCGERKLLDEFYIDRKRRTGRHPCCKSCERERFRIYRQKPETADRRRQYEKRQSYKDYKRQYNRSPQYKKYRQEYGLRPETKERKRQYQQREHAKAARREYRTRPETKELKRINRNKPENAQRHRERAKRWREQNREKCRQLKRLSEGRRRATKRANAAMAVSRDDIKHMLDLQRHRCAVCRKLLRNRYHIDHIAPLARGGIHARSNLQATCPECNLRKSDKDPIEFMRELGYLL